MASWVITENPAKAAAFGASAASSLTTMLTAGPVVGNPPGPPTVTVPTVTTNSITINWSAATAPADAPVQQYEVWIQRGTEPATNVIDVGPTVRAWNFTGLLQATSYTVWVNAVNKWGAGPSSNKPTRTTPGGALPGAPGAPTVVAGSITASSIGLSWPAALAPAGTVITDYRIYGGPQVVTVGGPQTTKAVTGLAAGQTYNFTVRAVGTNGEGPASSPLSAATTGGTGPVDPTDPPPTGTVVLYAAGDVAHVTYLADSRRTGALINGKADKDLVLMLGDGAYSAGSISNYTQYYAPAWGAFKAITEPAPGNHEYKDSSGPAAGYRSYFGTKVVGQSGKLYRWFIRGSWLFLQCDSGDAQGGVATSGIEAEQVTFMQNAITANRGKYTGILAYWHHPRFSSGNDGNNLDTGAMVTMLYNAKADIVLCGHDHNYERFAQMNAAGTAKEPGRGLRHFTVGTGGGSLRSQHAAKFGSEALWGGGGSYAQGRRQGVLRLALGPTSYSWEWLDASSPADLSKVDKGTTNINTK